MKTLALEFSSDQRSVAAGQIIEGRCEILGSAFEIGGRSTRAVGLIDACLRQAGWSRHEIESMVIGTGPGSYTGIRAAIALAQGWQLATGLKTLAVPSIEALRFQVQAAGMLGRVNLIIDAQRREFYLASYEVSSNGTREMESLHLVPLAEVENRLQLGQLVTGPEANTIPGGRLLYPTAAALLHLAATRHDFVPAEQLTPVYLRETTFVKAPPYRMVD